MNHHSTLAHAGPPWIITGIVSVLFLYSLSTVFAFKFWRDLANKDWMVQFAIWSRRVFSVLFAIVGLAFAAYSLSHDSVAGAIIPLAIAAMAVVFAFMAKSSVYYQLAILDTWLGSVMTRVAGAGITAISGYILYLLLKP